MSIQPENQTEAFLQAIARDLHCLTDRDVSALTGLSRTSQAERRHKGKWPPCVPLGQALLYPIDDFQMWLQAHLDEPHPKSRVRKITRGSA